MAGGCLFLYSLSVQKKEFFRKRNSKPLSHVVYTPYINKILIWFSLFFSAIINIVDGIGCLEYAGEVGGALFFGISEIALGLFLIFVRFQLSGYKVNAINLFTTAQVISIVLSVLAAIVTGIELDVSGIASAIGMIVITRAYYAKRAKFFVN